MEFIVLRRSGSLSVSTEFTLPKGFLSSWWRVTFRDLWPQGRNWQLRICMSWFLYLGFGERKAYRALLVQDASGGLAHRSMVFPRYSKEPFMEEGDLQICRTFTAPKYRGLGLAKYGVQEILRSGLANSAYYWYVVSPMNTASIQVARANGFEERGFGHKQPLIGISKLGKIVLSEHGNKEARRVPLAQATRSASRGC